MVRRARTIRAAITDRRVVRPFHRLFYDSGAQTWSNTYWLGVPAQKCPFDLWVYQEMLAELRPEVIVECGTAGGGSALFWPRSATCSEAVRSSPSTSPMTRVVRQHERITYLKGSSTDSEIVARVQELVGGRSPVIVILDSNHERDHVLDELRLYAQWSLPGSYLVVEDSNINGRPVLPELRARGQARPWKSSSWRTDEFAVDLTREKYHS